MSPVAQIRIVMQTCKQENHKLILTLRNITIRRLDLAHDTLGRCSIQIRPQNGPISPVQQFHVNNIPRKNASENAALIMILFLSASLGS